MINDKKILIIGSSSDIAQPLVEHLIDTNNKIGLHYCNNSEFISKYLNLKNVKGLQSKLENEKSCELLINEFVNWCGGIDILVNLMGGLCYNGSWEGLSQKDIENDLNINLILPFFTAKIAIKEMKRNYNGGKIILTSTASTVHGGGRDSLFYGVSKIGIEKIIRVLAKDNASNGILVNGVAPGFFNTKLTAEKIHRGRETFEQRLSYIPMKRCGEAKDLLTTYLYLMDDRTNYITGKVIVVDGGDTL